ncbi:hypothetical protein B0H13DRAFT_1855311 [Mycena leptocephala]|nr:hypothetical protein B0H13DRAFT_1855311 [Mycena leptocephala]
MRRRTATAVLAGDFTSLTSLSTDVGAYTHLLGTDGDEVQREENTMSKPTAASSSSFLHARAARPHIRIVTMQRSASVTPPPLLLPSTPMSTTGPYNSSSAARASFKQLQHRKLPVPRQVAAMKGWKGWVEGSPPPSEKLVSLIPVLPGRRTRSGKDFEGIAVGTKGCLFNEKVVVSLVGPATDTKATTTSCGLVGTGYADVPEPPGADGFELETQLN